MSLIDNVCSNVYETKDYDKFKILDGNREINTMQVEKIKESIKQGYILNPIIVNEKYEIADGQHRYSALKEYNMPIHYIIVHGMGLDECQRLNLNGKNWTTRDFVKSHADRGNKYYIKLMHFIGEYDVISDITTAVYILQNSKRNYKGNLNTLIRKGDFVFSDEDFENGIKTAEMIKEIAELTDVAKFVNCQRALMSIVNHPKYSHEKMLSKLEIHAHRLENIKSTVKISMFYEHFSDIYNFKSRNDDKIYFHIEFQC